MFGQQFPDARQALEHLKQRVNEKRSKEPHENFVNDHQLIHSRRRNQVCIPILPGHNQKMWFAKLDSNNIWQRVFEYVTNPSDITSAFFSCSMFRKHLEEKRKMMLLPKVFGVLRDTHHLQYFGFTHLRDSEFKQTQSKEILKLRIVSKVWKKAAEEVFLLPLSVTKSRPIYHPDSWDWSHEMVCRFEFVEQLELALEKLQNPSTCATLIRLIYVDDHWCEEKEEFFSKLLQFLDIHGESVWGIYYCFSRLDAAGCNFRNYERVWKIMSKSPHLKALTWSDFWDIESEDETEDAQIAIQRQHLLQTIAQNPFPNIPTLEYFHFDCYREEDKLVAAEILCKNPSIKAFHLRDLSWNYEDVTSRRCLWNTLQSAKLEYFKIFSQVHGPVFMDSLSNLEQTKWPLKFLKVVLDQCADADFVIDASSIFPAISNFCKTLVKFEYKEGLNVSLVNDRRSVMVVDLPRLTEISVDELENDEYYDDL